MSGMAKHFALAGFAAIVLSACGGGGGGASSAASANSATANASGASNATAGTASGSSSATATTAPTTNSTNSTNSTNVPAGSTDNAALNGIALLTPAGPSASNFVATGDIITDTFDYMNARRAELGLPALAYNSSVAQAASNHAAYMHLNTLVTHFETAGSPGYTGVSPTDRVTALYPTQSVGEIAAGFTGAFTSSTEPIEALFDAPFHRTIVTFDVATTGVGASLTSDPAQYSTLDVNFADYKAFVPDDRLLAYPYNGQANVKTGWFSNESPNPMANAPTYINKVVGYPVTLSASGAGAFSNVVFKIADNNGNDVACQETDNTSSDDAVRMSVCVPFTPLAVSTTYTVTVTGSLTNTSIPTPTPFSVTWSFTTAATANVPIGASSSSAATNATSATSADPAAVSKAAMGSGSFVLN